MATANNINANSAGLARYDGAGSWTGVTVVQHDLLIGAASNGITSLALTNGQLAIGNTGNDPTAATLTAGTGITITNGSGAITVAGVGGGLTWTVVTGTTQSATVNSGYICNNAGTVTVTLPTTAAVGSIVAVTGINNATGWTIAQSSGQQVFFGTASTTSGATGTLSSTATRDTVFLLCVVANTTFNVIDSIGNITIV
jgi:hypothetical protein